MSLNDSSAIILIVGALAVIAFVIHGLWFSGKISNRKLSKTSSDDQALQNTNGLGKVRIVSSGEEQASNNAPKAFTYIDSDVKTREPLEQLGDDKQAEGETLATKTEVVVKPLDVYEINIESETGHPFTGDHIADLFSEFGFVRTSQGLYVCPEYMSEDVSHIPVVFRICSLKKPYNFPEQMKDYETSAIALYMKLPEIGKAESYYSCMRSAASEVARRLGGKLVTTDGEIVTEQLMDEILNLLHEYDEPANIQTQVY